MARLNDVRGTIVPDTQLQQPPIDGVAVEGEHDFESSDTLPLSCRHCGQEERYHDTDDDVETSFDDEDLWEAIDLIETSVKMMRGLVKHCRMAPQRKNLVEKHCDDLQQFIELFSAAGDRL